MKLIQHYIVIALYEQYRLMELTFALKQNTNKHVSIWKWGM